MVTVKVEGFAEIEREMEKLSFSVGRGVLRRSLKKAGQPMADLMKNLAPRGDTATDRLAESITIGPKLSNRQAGQHRKMFLNDKSAAEMFVGPGPDPAAWKQEFGNVNHGAQSFARPAWDAEAQKTVNRLGPLLWDEMEKSVARAARKAARAG